MSIEIWSQSVSFGLFFVFILKLTARLFCFTKNKFVLVRNHYLLNFRDYLCRRFNMSDEHYLSKSILVSEISLILYYTRLMTRRLQFDIYHLLRIFVSEEKFHLQWKWPLDMQMVGFNDFIVNKARAFLSFNKLHKALVCACLKLPY